MYHWPGQSNVEFVSNFVFRISDFRRHGGDCGPARIPQAQKPAAFMQHFSCGVVARLSDNRVGALSLAPYTTCCCTGLAQDQRGVPPRHHQRKSRVSGKRMCHEQMPLKMINAHKRLLPGKSKSFCKVNACPESRLQAGAVCYRNTVNFGNLTRSKKTRNPRQKQGFSC